MATPAPLEGGGFRLAIRSRGGKTVLISPSNSNAARGTSIYGPVVESEAPMGDVVFSRVRPWWPMRAQCYGKEFQALDTSRLKP